MFRFNFLSGSGTGLLDWHLSGQRGVVYSAGEAIDVVCGHAVTTVEFAQEGLRLITTRLVYALLDYP